MFELAGARRTVRDLAAAGVRVTVDDFGAGFSSLRALRTLLIHEIKLDRSLMHGLPARNADVAIVDAALAVGRRLRVRVVAKGVEDEAQLAAVRGLGGRFVQGHVIAAPMPHAQLASFVRDFRLLPVAAGFGRRSRERNARSEEA